VPETFVLDRSGIAAVLSELRDRDYTLVGPTIQQDAIGYGPIASLDDLPEGWTNVQAPGSSHLERRDDDHLFGYVVGPHSWKKYLMPSEVVIWKGHRTDSGFETVPVEPSPAFAFVGVRPCELAAIAVQDRVFMDGGGDPTYRDRRDSAFIVAVNCTEPGANCFCTSMGTGPAVGSDSLFDLALTEVDRDGKTVYLIESGSEKGAEVLRSAAGESPMATEADLAALEEILAAAAASISKTMETDGVRELLLANLRNGYWEDVGARCLSCTNCTMVCPTCFCNTVEDNLSLDAAVAERTRKWDSCFSIDFSYIHGGPLRTTPEARYRQWLTHKLATWFDQYGTSGCVGCGRCITWCPVGIDLTAEVAALRRVDARQGLSVPLPEVMA
jgi:ferredoxin